MFELPSLSLFFCFAYIFHYFSYLSFRSCLNLEFSIFPWGCSNLGGCLNSGCLNLGGSSILEGLLKFGGGPQKQFYCLSLSFAVGLPREQAPPLLEALLSRARCSTLHPSHGHVLPCQALGVCLSACVRVCVFCDCSCICVTCAWWVFTAPAVRIAYACACCACLHMWMITFPGA